MRIYLHFFVNGEQNNWVKLLPIAEFAYNNIKNASISYTYFELNYGYHPCKCFEDKVDSDSKSCSADKRAKDLRQLMSMY